MELRNRRVWLLRSDQGGKGDEKKTTEEEEEDAEAEEEEKKGKRSLWSVRNRGNST